MQTILATRTQKDYVLNLIKLFALSDGIKLNKVHELIERYKDTYTPEYAQAIADAQEKSKPELYWQLEYLNVEKKLLVNLHSNSINNLDLEAAVCVANWLPCRIKALAQLYSNITNTESSELQFSQTIKGQIQNQMDTESKGRGFSNFDLYKGNQELMQTAFLDIAHKIISPTLTQDNLHDRDYQIAETIKTIRPDLYLRMNTADKNDDKISPWNVYAALIKEGEYDQFAAEKIESLFNHADAADDIITEQTRDWYFNRYRTITESQLATLDGCLSLMLVMGENVLEPELLKIEQSQGIQEAKPSL